MKTRLLRLFNECLAEADAIGINYGKIDRITVSYKDTHWFGICHKFTDFYTIEIAHFILGDNTTDEQVKNTIMHEILHTCPNCMRHNSNWKRKVNMVNDCYAFYHISTYSEFEDFGLSVEKVLKPKYILKCEKCSYTIGYQRKCKIVNHPSLYCCGKCGGDFCLI